MACEKCGFQIGESDKFCQECGSSLSKQCDSCGKALPVSVKFCPECGAPRSSTKPLDRGEQSVVVDVRQSQIAPYVAEYTGPAFLLPGAELWFGERRETSQNIGVTRDINVITIGMDDEGFRTATRSGEPLSGADFQEVEIAWVSEGQFYFRNAFYRTSSPLRPEEDVRHIYLVNSRAIPAPDLQDAATVVLPMDSQSSVERVNQALMEEGWKGLGNNVHTFLAINNSVVFTKSGVKKGWAIFWFLMGIGCGIIYIIIAQNRPKTLYLSFATVTQGYCMVHFTGTNMDMGERLALAQAVQRRFLVP